MLTNLRFVLLTLVALVTGACATPAAQGGDPPPPPVTAAEAVTREVTEWREFTGRLEAVHHVDVRPRVSGLVASVHFTEGAIVRRGDLLFQIDARPFQADVDRLRAELLRAEAARSRTAAERDRATRLAQDSAMSAEEHDRRVSSADEAEAQVAAVRAALRAAELHLEFTRVTAPIAGRVGRAIVTEGNLVAAGPGEATLLTTVVSLDPVHASFEVDEPSFMALSRSLATSGRAAGRERRTVRMALAGDADFTREGRLDFLDNELDPATGTIRVRAVFGNGDGALTPGLFARLRLNSDAAYVATLVRDDAVGTDLDKRFVYVLDAEGTVAYRPVTLGPLVDGLRVVRNGLEPDSVVVVNGLQRIRPGMKVRAAVESMERAR